MNIFDSLQEEIMQSNLSETEKDRRIALLSKARSRKINLMLVGVSGAGKSSTINALFDMSVAKVGIGADPETKEITKFDLGNLTIWDTPGLGDGVTADKVHVKQIAKKLTETDVNGDSLIDLVLVVLDASSKDLSVSYDVINNTLIPILGRDNSHRILIGLNQSDLAMKGRNWDIYENAPNQILQDFLSQKCASLKRRIYEATGVMLEPICYSAGYTDGSEKQEPYNLSKLLYYILTAVPSIIYPITVKGGLKFMSAIIAASTENMSYEDWLEYRKSGIGGSDASVVCGISRYKSPVELWMEKTNQLPYQEAGEAAYWGIQLEALVKTEFTKRTNIEIKPVNQILKNEEHPFMLANLDGTCEHPNYGTCVFEAKTASAYKSAEWNDSIPDEYMLQIQHYMAVTGYKGAYIAVLIGGNMFRWKFVERDEELIAMLIQLEADFWEHVQSAVPPTLDGSEASAKFLDEKFPNSAAKSQIMLPNTAIDLIHQYNEACEQLKAVTEQKQEAENLLKQMIGENETGTVGNWVVAWKSISQEKLDSKTLKAEHPVLYKKYANKTSYRRFSVKSVL